jgi:acyl dehydratase
MSLSGPEDGLPEARQVLEVALGSTTLTERAMNPVEMKDLPGLVGQEVGVSDWLQITQERVNQFADATGDHQWIHVNVERATKEIGGPIAHGYLTLSLIPFLSAGMLPVKGVTRGINYGSDKVRFTTWSASESASGCARS